MKLMTMTEQIPGEQLIPDITDDKERLRQIIEAGRDMLSDDQMDVLFTLYESDSMSEAAAELGRSEADIASILVGINSDIANPKPIEVETPEVEAPVEAAPNTPRPERVNKKGVPYKKRLARTAYVQILLEHDDLSDDERAVIKAIAESANQSIAAQLLGMTYKEFDQAHSRIRREHGF